MQTKLNMLTLSIIKYDNYLCDKRETKTLDKIITVESKTDIQSLNIFEDIRYYSVRNCN